MQGVHRARPARCARRTPGFGYLVASLVDALRAGEPFTVWECDRINTVATPTLATDAAELILRMLERGRDRRSTTASAASPRAAPSSRARPSTCSASTATPALRPAARRRRGAPVPYDTRLDAPPTAAALDVELPSLRAQLERLRREFDAVR